MEKKIEATAAFNVRAKAGNAKDTASNKLNDLFTSTRIWLKNECSTLHFGKTSGLQLNSCFWIC